MPWLSKADAANALGISSRTLTRGVADGMVEAKREGSRVLVHVRDDHCHMLQSATGGSADGTRPATNQSHNRESTHPERPDEADQQSTETAGSAEGGQEQEDGAVAEAMVAIREARAAIVETASIARMGAQQAIAVRQRTVQYLKWVGAVSLVVVVFVAVVGGWSAWQSDGASMGPSGVTRELRQGVSDAPDDSAQTVDMLQETLDAERQATAMMLREFEERISQAQGEALEAQTQTTQVTLHALDKRLSELTVALHTIEARQEEIACEWDQLIADREQADLERAQLADRTEALTQGVPPVDPAPTLREIIDKDWTPRR